MDKSVLIVGAGPTGLVLALWLTKQGVSVRIVDITSAPGTTSRAMAVQARTLELYRQLGIADQVVQAGMINPQMNLWIKGKKRASLSFGDAGKDLTPYPFLLVFPQDHHERLLTQKLEELGVRVERQTECTSFEEHGDRVIAQLLRSNGSTEAVEASFIVGCDGARSMVRRQIGSGFPGGTYDRLFYVADVEASGPQINGQVHIALDEADFAAWMSYDNKGHGRLIGTVKEQSIDGTKELTFSDVQHQAVDRIGLKVDKVNWFSTYHVHHRVTDHYRKGRAILAGDAAHIHSPAGGQGMNTGIGDAINLAWKLAMVLRDEAPDSLLDSYEAERRAFALKLVETTDRIFSFASAEGNFADFVRTRIAPIFAPMLYDISAVREYMFRVVSQTMISYHSGPIAKGQAGEIRGGDRLPWVREADNYGSLAEITWQVHVYGVADESLMKWCNEKAIPLNVFAFSENHANAGLVQDAAYLIRPDTYIACVMQHQDAAVFDEYLESCIASRKTNLS